MSGTCAVLTEFAGYDTGARPHRTLGLETPLPADRPSLGPIRARPVPGGLHHTYERAALITDQSLRPHSGPQQPAGSACRAAVAQAAGVR
jgi:hypothetical protein